ncbi:MAG: type II secretion system protein [Phycisphaerae bacterium]
MNLHATQLGDRGDRGGFTLVELLVVIAIIALLATLAIPVALSIRQQAKESASLALLNSIGIGIDHYYSEMDEQYPPAREGGMNSAETICFYMLGYADDPGREGEAMSGGRAYYEDDGIDGYGWMKPGVHRGPRHGPYAGLEEKAKLANTGSPGEWVFVDTFDRPVWYGVYRNGGIDTGGIPGMSNEQNYFKSRDDEYYRKDFVLVTSGKDGDFKAIADDPTSDDIANFFSE